MNERIFVAGHLTAVALMCVGLAIGTLQVTWVGIGLDLLVGALMFAQGRSR